MLSNLVILVTGLFGCQENKLKKEKEKKGIDAWKV
jgi:hypothetical protein